MKMTEIEIQKICEIYTGRFCMVLKHPWKILGKNCIRTVIAMFIQRDILRWNREKSRENVDKIFPPLEESEKQGNFLSVEDGIWFRYEDLKEADHVHTEYTGGK